ncbi:head-tail joining protein, partial [Nostoc linckia]
MGVRLSDFSQAPRRMDICIIRGVTYRVLRSEPDGDGGSMLYLEKT